MSDLEAPRAPSDGWWHVPLTLRGISKRAGHQPLPVAPLSVSTGKEKCATQGPRDYPTV